MSRYAKFLVALIPVILAGLNVVYDALTDNVVTTQEWVAVAVAALAAAAVYAVPNKAPAGELADPSQSEVGPYVARHRDGGESVLYIVLVVAVILVLLAILGVV